MMKMPTGETGGRDNCLRMSRGFLLEISILAIQSIHENSDIIMHASLGIEHWLRNVNVTPPSLYSSISSV